MKVCLISYDFWDYDRYIVEALKKRGIEAVHIKLCAYRYPSLSHRVKNAFSKIFLKKNYKKIWRQEMIINSLKKLGKQDQILVINPETIEGKYHQEIKKYTEKYIAYLYDALARNPAEGVLPYFDEVYSFDKEDIAKHHFKETTNYIYLEKPKDKQNPKYDLMYLGSYDERTDWLYKIAEKMDEMGKSYRFILVTRKAWKKKWTKNKSFVFISERISLEELSKNYRQARVILDLVREHQSGLSFRIFEAMALDKKIITTNPNIRKYDFYNVGNILVLDEALTSLEKSFFETPYQTLPEEIESGYTIDTWVAQLFNLPDETT